MKWYFNKRLVHTRANGGKNNMFLFQQNWIKDIVVNINRIGIKKKSMFHIVGVGEHWKELSGLCTGLERIT